MRIREAIESDIPEIQVVRNSVTENTLSDPSRITNAMVHEFITERGKGWVCEADGLIAGFSIADLKDHNVWALFLRPVYERRGIGRKLHDIMLNWYFAQTDAKMWLSTTPGTRAETFYRAAGWRETGPYGKGEIRFEMTAEEWGMFKDK